MKNKTLFFIPTYNEIKNLEQVFKEISQLNLDADVLFMDDNSPDGTAAKIEELRKKNDNIYLIKRDKKKGIGTAHQEGIKWAYQNKYAKLITLDCDLTHSPKDALRFIENSNECDIVVGSRFLRKDSLKDWNFFRKFLTHLGHLATRLILNRPFDFTGAYRLYNLQRISEEFLEIIESKSYSFFFESLMILSLNNFSIKEIKIDLPARTYGHSKMRFYDAICSLALLVKFKLNLIFNSHIFMISNAKKIVINQNLIDPQNWSNYWKTKSKKKIFFIYTMVASFYRKFIIRPNLNKILRRNFDKNDKIIHAGCGGGQVDIEVSNYLKITALDISSDALDIYKKTIKNVDHIIHGSIFSLPFEEQTYDGIYNLGVMEHFNREEVVLILKEFHRVLKTKKKIILFWPPEYGLSVGVLKIIHFILNKILKKNIYLHPPEILRIKSKKFIIKIFEECGFELEDFSFGIKDFFTYVVVVGKKIN